MSKKSTSAQAPQRKLLLSAAEMAKVSGIGENTLRTLMGQNKIEYLQVGSHRLLSEQAIWDYYDRNKTSVVADMRGQIRLLRQLA